LYSNRQLNVLEKRIDVWVGQFSIATNVATTIVVQRWRQDSNPPQRCGSRPPVDLQKGCDEVMVQTILLSYRRPVGPWTGFEPVASSFDALSPCSPLRQSHCSKLLNEDVVEIIALIACSCTQMQKQPTVGTREASQEDAGLAHYLGSLQVRYLRIVIVRMESRAAVEHCSSVLFPKSTRRDWYHQKQPECRQQRLKCLPLPQGHGSFRPSFSSSSLSPCTMRTPRLTLVSDGKPRRRLLMGSKKGIFKSFVPHDRAPSQTRTW